MTYRTLHRLIQEIVGALRARGIAPSATVATVLENGPVAASSFLALGCGVACAPLNPAFRAAELRFYLEDLRCAAVVTERGANPEVHEVAADLGLPVIEAIANSEDPAGWFRLGDAGPVTIAPNEDDVALILHTSGTTARPKIVPLAHKNLAASALNIADTLALGATDTCLNA
jgi:acyl-CoA synthetase (AMP-forming)/AMP-acid ligase II